MLSDHLVQSSNEFIEIENAQDYIFLNDIIFPFSFPSSYSHFITSVFIKGEDIYFKIKILDKEGNILLKEEETLPQTFTNFTEYIISIEVNNLNPQIYKCQLYVKGENIKVKNINFYLGTQ